MIFVFLGLVYGAGVALSAAKNGYSPLKAQRGDFAWPVRVGVWVYRRSKQP